MHGIRSRSLVALAVAASLAAQQSEWRSLANGHRCRTVAIDGATGLAVAVSIPWPAQKGPTGNEPGLAYGLAAAEAARRAAAADAALPRHLRTQVEVGNGRTGYCIAFDSANAVALEAWFAALAAPLAHVPAGERSDLVQRDLALAALAADDSDWLYPGDRLAGVARREALAGSPFDTGVRGDAEAVLRASATAFAERLAAVPSSPWFVAALGDREKLAAVESALAALSPPHSVPPASAPSISMDSVPPIDLAASPRLEPHPRVDAGFAAVALLPLPLDRGGLADAVAIEVLRRRARQRFVEFRGAEVLARAPFVQADVLAGDPLVVLHRRAPTPDFLDPAAMAAPPTSFVAVPHRELVEFVRDCEHTPVRAEEASAALAVVRAEWALPPYADALQGAMRRLPQAMLAPVRTLCHFGVRGFDDARVRDGLALDATGVSAALQALARRVVWHGGLVPIPPKATGG